jgi:hypothetical protein
MAVVSVDEGYEEARRRIPHDVVVEAEPRPTPARRVFIAAGSCTWRPSASR